jgi:hypothetical protein
MSTPDSIERNQQELMLQITLGGVLMAIKGMGRPGSGKSLC